ncbi:MAG: hypothetical protein EKK45_10810 [Curvibacter sp.]|nr:MAG: hypothetical protein EKK45_10810 [Curvibacter sp.]
MANSLYSIPSKKKSLLFSSFLISSSIIFIFCFFFNPHWETNDDVAMSMVAHGYGIAAVGMPNLVFSNVIWGYLVRSIPKIYGVLGYSSASISVLVIIGTVLLHALRKLGLAWLLSLPLLLLILVRPVLFPQFTINAGLLTVGAIVCWYFYEQEGDKRSLVIGCCLAFLGYIIRSQQFLMVLLISAPLLPWSKLLKDSKVIFFTFALIFAICTAILIDQYAYQSDDWQAFKKLNPARAYITDFGFDVLLKQRPDILFQNGYTQNDINLLHSWFFVDTELANPSHLIDMINKLGPTPGQSHLLTNGLLGIKAFADPVLFSTFIVAILLLFALPSRKLLLVWILTLLAVFGLGLLGRPGILRVYIPLLSMLLIAPFLQKGYGASAHLPFLLRCSLIGIITAGAFFNLITVLSQSKVAQVDSEVVHHDLNWFPEETVVLWGSSFPYESAYPVLWTEESMKPLKLYGLGTFTLTPFSVAYQESSNGRGMLDRLFSNDGIPILAQPYLLEYLRIYCLEHFDGRLQELGEQKFGPLHISRQRCDKKIKPR